MKRPDNWTIIALLQRTTRYFEEQDLESPRLDAELLLAFALGIERIDLYLRHDQPLNPDELDRFRALVKRRKDREPVAYITGTKAFWDLDLAVSPEVLIPRPETECVVEAALAFLNTCAGRPERRILDLGTGSGAIALALARSCPEDIVVAVDRSSRALAVAHRNCRRHDLHSRVGLVAGDWADMFSATKARFDLIVSNPPYIPSREIDALQPEIARYEPRMALDGGPDGLDCLRRIIRQAPDLLRQGGALILEIGHAQYPAVQGLAESCHRYRDIACRMDYAGLQRVAYMVCA
jgi:release factor glutamine methyltransferase